MAFSEHAHDDFEKRRPRQARSPLLVLLLWLVCCAVAAPILRVSAWHLPGDHVAIFLGGFASRLLPPGSGIDVSEPLDAHTPQSVLDKITAISRAQAQFFSRDNPSHGVSAGAPRRFTKDLAQIATGDLVSGHLVGPNWWWFGTPVAESGWIPLHELELQCEVLASNRWTVPKIVAMRAVGIVWTLVPLRLLVGSFLLGTMLWLVVRFRKRELSWRHALICTSLATVAISPIADLVFKSWIVYTNRIASMESHDYFAALIGPSGYSLTRIGGFFCIVGLSMILCSIGADRRNPHAGKDGLMRWAGAVGLGVGCLGLLWPWLGAVVNRLVAESPPFVFAF